MTQLGSCRQGDHEACIRSVFPERKDCTCACHKMSSMVVGHRPTSRDPRVTSRQKSWNQHWYYAAFPSTSGAVVKEYVDETIVREPLTKEELWSRLQTHR